MADKKISELNSLTGANAADGDLVAIVDVSATETKKITRSEFFKSVPSIDGGIVFNESGADVDFRIESDTDTHAFFLRGSDGNVGIGTSSPSAKLEVDAGSATNTHLQITTTGFGHNFDMVDGRSTARIRNTDGSLRLSADHSNEQPGSEIVFLIDGSEKIHIDASGHAIIPGGVTLGTAAGTYTAANTLDDYEEGTWTPVPQDSSGNSGTAATASGYYTKVGNLVTLNFLLDDIDTTGLTAGNDFRITGLPFTSKTLVGTQFYHGSLRMTNAAFDGNISLGILDSTDYIRIVETVTGAAIDFTVVSQVTSGTTTISGTITYMA